MHDSVLTEEFYRDLAARVSERMMKELPKEDELSRQLSFTPSFERKMELLFANPKPTRTQNHRAWRVLAVAVVILILLFSALMSVSAVREAVFKFFTDLYENYIVAWYEPEVDALVAPETILEFREPSYVPQGFERSIMDKSELQFILSYLNDEGLFLLFRQTIIDSNQYAFDIEEDPEKVFFDIHGNTAMYRIKNGLLDMVWIDNEYSYYLSGQIDVEQALMMAHSIE